MGISAGDVRGRASGFYDRGDERASENCECGAGWNPARRLITGDGRADSPPQVVNLPHISKRTGAALFLALCLVFLVVNRAAYHGYFQDDEIDNISWTGLIPLATYLKALVSPVLDPNN